MQASQIALSRRATRAIVARVTLARDVVNPLLAVPVARALRAVRTIRRLASRPAPAISTRTMAIFASTIFTLTHVTV